MRNHTNFNTIWEAVASHPRDGEWQVRITAVDPDTGRRAAGFPVIELPCVSLEHASAIAMVYNSKLP